MTNFVNIVYFNVVYWYVKWLASLRCLSLAPFLFLIKWRQTFVWQSEKQLAENICIQLYRKSIICVRRIKSHRLCVWNILPTKDKKKRVGINYIWWTGAWHHLSSSAWANLVFAGVSSFCRRWMPEHHFACDSWQVFEFAWRDGNGRFFFQSDVMFSPPPIINWLSFIDFVDWFSYSDFHPSYIGMEHFMIKFLCSLFG